MKNSGSSDPLDKVRSESSRFNVAWMKHGELLTLTQRIGYAVFSLFFFAAGLVFVNNMIQELRSGALLGASGWLLPSLI